MSVSLVVPTVGRPSLDVLLQALAAGEGPRPARIVLVDDRPAGAVGGLAGRVPELLRERTVVLRGAGAGPAAARNLGWRACRTAWVCVLDDDVVPEPGWAAALGRDVALAAPGVAAVQGRVTVPLPAGRRPTDWERNVASLETSRWITADMALRRDVLAGVGGFDERFPRAYREDADLALRLMDAGWSLTVGERAVRHPVGPAPWSVSVAKQAGNADDALMDRLHGDGWRERAEAPAGAFRRHALTVAAGATALAAGAVAAATPPAAHLGRWRRTGAPAEAWRHRRGVAGVVAGVAGGAWGVSTARFAWRRIAPGPRDAREVLTMAATSAVLPVAAVRHRLAGVVRARRIARRPVAPPAPPAAVLLDRDGTIVVDVPYNGDPEAVRPMAGARAALDRLRAAGVPLAVVSNQSGIARGLLSREQVEAVNARVAEELGPFDAWRYCPHGPEDGCACRKPAPGMLLDAARALGVDPADCVMVGDIGADVEAARAAGATPFLVPTPVTRAAEVDAAPQVAPDLGAVVDALLGTCDAAPKGAAGAPVPGDQAMARPVGADGEERA